MAATIKASVKGNIYISGIKVDEYHRLACIVVRGAKVGLDNLQCRIGGLSWVMSTSINEVGTDCSLKIMVSVAFESGPVYQAVQTFVADINEEYTC